MARRVREPGMGAAWMPVFVSVFLALFTLFAGGSEVLAASAKGPSQAEARRLATYRGWIKEMKQASRGPFERIRWFCADGTVLPPKAYACAKHGGGIQHGEWNDRVVTMRKSGYLVANLLADLKPARFTGPGADLGALKQILIERFLMAADKGWIFRRALTYRGAFQIEDEQAAAEKVILAMLQDPLWLTAPRYGLLREVVRLFPRKDDSASASKVRLLSKELHEADAGFEALRAKIHGVPGLEDAAKVREYAKSRGKQSLMKDYLVLADLIEKLYSPANIKQVLQQVRSGVQDAKLRSLIDQSANDLSDAANPARRLAVASQLMVALRDALPKAGSARARLAMLHASLDLERTAFTSGSALTPGLATATRRQQLDWLRKGTGAIYGSGLISQRQMNALDWSLEQLMANNNLQAEAFRKEVHYLSRAAGWAGRNMAFLFEETLAHLAPLEPLVHFYPQDRLRGSPLFFHGVAVDGLIKDANRLANLEHRFFGQSVGAGLRALNPGIARGTLREPGKNGAITDSEGVYLLPETISDLPPVKGILTLGEGNALSHVQLLARNLGIPNVVVGNSRIAEVRKQIGARVILAANPDGVVELDHYSAKWDRFFKKSKTGQSGPGDFKIVPDLAKLDLEHRRIIPLSELRATDSGRLSGPKSANLGELRHLFGEMVPNGIVIPFGTFREFLDQPLEPGGEKIFDWMKRNYAEIAALPENRRKARVAAFLDRLRARIQKGDLGPGFAENLRAALADNFGPDGSFGVFVRSDTNVEDLPGFTGAGLNETIANVVGHERILDAIKRVWASPFTERAYAWRQAHMDQPEFVFPAVLVQYSFPSEKSGVMVTKDVEWNEPGWISVAVNEGIGGAVDGQAAESLRIETATGRVRMLSQATAPLRRVLDPQSGLGQRPASGSDRVLQNGEIRQLMQLARDIPRKFPSLKDEQGNPSTADVEFAFRDGKLALLQIRPLVEAKLTGLLGFAVQADAAKARQSGGRVSLDEVSLAAK